MTTGTLQLRKQHYRNTISSCGVGDVLSGYKGRPQNNRQSKTKIEYTETIRTSRILIN